QSPRLSTNEIGAHVASRSVRHAVQKQIGSLSPLSNESRCPNTSPNVRASEKKQTWNTLLFLELSIEEFRRPAGSAPVIRNPLSDLRHRQTHTASRTAG